MILACFKDVSSIRPFFEKRLTGQERERRIACSELVALAGDCTYLRYAPDSNLKIYDNSVEEDTVAW